MTAMIYCPDCNKQIPGSEKNCPHCGYPVDEIPKPALDNGKHGTRPVTGIILTAAGIILAILGFTGVINFGSGTPYSCITGLILAGLGLVIYLLGGSLKE